MQVNIRIDDGGLVTGTQYVPVRSSGRRHWDEGGCENEARQL